MAKKRKGTNGNGASGKPKLGKPNPDETVETESIYDADGSLVSQVQWVNWPATNGG